MVRIEKMQGHESNNKSAANENNSKTISRKEFFKRLGLLGLLPLAALWYTTVERSQLRENQKKMITIPGTLPQGISFFDKLIVIKNDEKVAVLSAKCTHLGCIINKAENGMLVCPCHGSEFSSSGKVIKGPADKPLKRLPFKTNKNTGEITVNVVA